ncbi:hypothetical protein C656_06875 [Enterococcus hirae 57-03-H11]|nr:hypothetical protein C656_06875 [Enterococcus hirae 57-03-H11]
MIQFKDQQLTISENYLPGQSVVMNVQLKNKLYFSISVMGPQGENLFSMSWISNQSKNLKTSFLCLRFFV